MRMNRDDYWSADPAAPDRFYSGMAAVLRDWEFDRAKFRIAGSTFRGTDLTHWLALDVAATALEDAGFPGGEGLPRKGVGVVLGNSLTGEFSRANLMRLRWPYVRRTVGAALLGKGWSDSEVEGFLRDLEPVYKAPFPAIDEDTLAGGLANTIAGRICNHFDFGGGGFTVDGACSSSLLAIVTGAKALVDGDLDVAVAGGVDLSIDPFEVIGFAKTGALATGEMKIYDADSNGFWPGEGSGVVVLMREEDAIARNLRIYATITGWGMSSDGKGGITRPESEGHQLAISRAYDRAGYGVDTVSYFEGHGTGTAVGDATEIHAIGTARHNADPTARPAALSSIKGNIGHTKAAAGIAGLIKATLAIHHQIIPPATGHHTAHPTLSEVPLYIPDTAGLWPADMPVRAGVSAMGFGGINTHIALEQPPNTPRATTLPASATSLVTTRQDTELLLFTTATPEDLRDKLTQLVTLTPQLSYAEIADLATTLAQERPTGAPGWTRAAIVTSSPEDATAKIERLLAALETGENLFSPGAYLNVPRPDAPAPKIAFLFPGQGTSTNPRTGGALRQRFPATDAIYTQAGFPAVTDGTTDTRDFTATEVAQPRIVAGSLAALHVLDQLGIRASAAIGHSLGEISALAWAGALTPEQAVTLATTRGATMANASHTGGAMASLTTTPEIAQQLIDATTTDGSVVIAAYNGPHNTIIAGPTATVDAIATDARDQGVTTTRLNTSHAFHSPQVEPAATHLREHLAADNPFGTPTGTVISTVTGQVLDAGTDLTEHLTTQVTHPVRYHQAATQLADDVVLAIELGPGATLTGLTHHTNPNLHTLPTDTDNPTLTPLLNAVAAAHTVGADVDTKALLADRPQRTLDISVAPNFLTNPCETAPELDIEQLAALTESTTDASAGTETGGEEESDRPSTLDLLRKLAAERVELPLDTVTANTHPLDDLHLSSITVGQIVNDVTRELGLPTLELTTSFATVTLGELAEIIDEAAESEQGGGSRGTAEATGVAPWVRPFSVDYVPAREPRVTIGAGPEGSWEVHASPGHPLAERLRAALSEAGIGDGILLCLPANGEEHVGLFLAAGKAAVAAPEGTRFVVVQQKYGASGLARTAFLESGGAPTTIVSLPDVAPATPAEADEAVRRVLVEAAATTKFSEVRYDEQGQRLVPLLTVLQPPAQPSTATPLDATDVLLVTGGGKGITAECALVMALDSGAKLALIGRDEAHADEELVENLARMAAAGIEYQYERADVTDPTQVAEAIARFQANLGTVTAVMHGAGRNVPSALPNLTEEEFHQTLAPKIAGLRTILDGLDQDRIKLLVTFGSIIGRGGLNGEAHYSTANDWMSELTADFQAAHPNARALALEWSVWSGAGMGEKLGVVQMLLRDGITPISLENGLSVLRQVLADPNAGPILTVSGRMGGLPTLPLDTGQELPLTRFVDRILAHYPDVELITEVELSPGSDPYLSDHQLDGDLLFPAVLGMEAMTQVASAVTGRTGSPLLEDVEFLRPIVVRPGHSTVIRLAALVKDEETVAVTIRAEDTGFGADHFRTTLRLPRPELADQGLTREATELTTVPVDPITDLYGSVLFQGKRFQRLLSYRRASARHAVAELATTTPAPWFAPYLPPDLTLADPGTRDAVMHAIQCCVPDATLLPQGVERLHLSARADQATEYVIMDARERVQDGDSYTYDIDVLNPDGQVIEQWQGLTLRAVRKGDGSGPWTPAMLTGHLERALETTLGGTRAVVVEPGGEHREQVERAVGRAVGGPATVQFGPDGGATAEGVTISSAHGAGVSLVVAGEQWSACDVAPVARRTAREWTDLVGQSVLDQLSADEDGDVAGSRVTSALACVPDGAELTVERVEPYGWVVFAAGDVRVATWVTTLNDEPEPVVFAVARKES